jgi:hypothetical protein
MDKSEGILFRNKLYTSQEKTFLREYAIKKNPISFATN